MIKSKEIIVMRTSNSIRNSIISVIDNIITIIFLFVGQTFFVKILGIDYSGLNGLFNNILTILNLIELGIGSSITYNLYRYVKNNDEDNIKSIMNFFRKSYNIIIMIIFMVGFIISIFIKYFIKEVTVDINIYIVYILFLLGTVSSYVLSYKRNLIYANQKNYIYNIIHIIYIILLTSIQIFILYLTKNYYIYLGLVIIFNLLENIFINYKANKLYPYLKDKDIKPLDSKIKDSIIKRVKALVIHKSAYSITSGTDNVLISSFLGLNVLGLYTNYNYIITAVSKIFSNIISSTIPSVGNLLVEKNIDNNYRVFKKIRFLNYWIAVFTSISIFILTEPFIKLWLGKEYLLSKIVLIVLVINFFQTMMRTSYNTFKEAAGIWIEDRYMPILQASINLVISIILLKLIGLPGIFIGTIISSLVVWLYSYPRFIYIGLLGRNIFEYIKDIILHILLFIVIAIITYLINMFSNNFIISMIICILIPNIILLVIYYKTDEFKYYFELIKKILFKRK